MGVVNPRWSPDGKLIAFTDIDDKRTVGLFGFHRIYVISADGGSPILLLAGRVGDPTWSPDGQLIAYDFNAQGIDSEVRILDLQTQKSSTVAGSRGFWSPRWSPDGKYLAALRSNVPKLALFKFATQKWETLPGGVFGWPAWSHDSNFVYVVNRERNSLVRFNVADHRMEQIASLQGFRSTAYLNWWLGWFGLTPDDRPITTRDTGIEEIYGFDLEYE
jgi:WD40 repeat protein